MERDAKVAYLEPWLTKKQLAEHLGCKVRWVEYRMAEGMPHAVIAGRVKFRASEVEPWLRAHGHWKDGGLSDSSPHEPPW